MLPGREEIISQGNLANERKKDEEVITGIVRTKLHLSLDREILPNDSLKDLFCVDSLDLVSVVMAVEDHFDVEIWLGDSEPPNSVRELREALDKSLVGKKN